MKLRYEPITLELEVPFRIAHGTSTTRHNVLLQLDDGEQVGLGEAAPVLQHHETQSSVLRYLAELPDPGNDPFQMEEILAALPPGSRAARAALDMALHDLVGKRLGLPLYSLFGLNPGSIPQGMFTLGIGPKEEIQAKAQAAAERFSLLKLKLDREHHVDLVRAVRAVTDARLVADANCGWSEDEALVLIPALADLGLEWIEQPLPEEDWEGLRRVRQASPIPIFADEPVRSARDIAKLAGIVDGVNIKLMKAGGLREALRMIAVARAHDLQVMLGCMVETSVGITAAAHLAPLVDWADLDGNLLIRNDPFVGVAMEKDIFRLPERAGLGVVAREPEEL